MSRFGWVGGERIPSHLDLRNHGWELAPLPADLALAEFPLLLAGVPMAVTIRSARVRARMLVAEIADPPTRAHLLALGFGDVAAADATGAELALRAGRLATALAALPRHRSHGAMVLDLIHREGWVGRHRLGLHPREFALLWRLAETPGEQVSQTALLGEVWNLAHRPETNSLAVHVCRLRAKLAGAGLPDLIHTGPVGYYLRRTESAPARLASPAHPAAAAACAARVEP